MAGRVEGGVTYAQVVFCVWSNFCCLFATLEWNDSGQIATCEIYNMKFESSGEDAVADVYSYTFGTQLARQGGGAAIPVSGSFTVDYNTLKFSNVSVTANIFNFVSGFVLQSGNPDGSVGYEVQLSY